MSKPAKIVHPAAPVTQARRKPTVDDHLAAALAEIERLKRTARPATRAGRLRVGTSLRAVR